MKPPARQPQRPAAVAAPRHESLSALAAPILQTLRRVSARHLRVRLVEGVARLVFVGSVLAVFQCAADYAFNLPWKARLCLLAGDLAVVAVILWRDGVVPVRRRLSASGAALLVERTVPGYRSALISAVELAAAPPGSAAASPALVRKLVSQMTVRLKNDPSIRRIVDTAAARRWAWRALLAAAVAAGLFAGFAPKTRILLERLFLSRQPLPTQTIVVAVSGDMSLVLGADATLSARAQGVLPRTGHLFVKYAHGEKENLLLTPGVDDPALFTATLRNVQQPFDYQFELNDGVGPTFHVEAMLPPALASCRFVQRYPAYTGLKDATMSAGNLTLLAGSRVRVEGRATQALRSAAVEFEGGKPAPVPLGVESDRHAVGGEFTVPKEGLSGFSLALVNDAGIASVENTVYRVEFVPDAPPAIDLSSPAAERSTVLLSARPVLNFSVRDDFGVRQVKVCYEVERPAPPGVPPPVEPGGIALTAPGAASFQQRFVWDLAGQQPALTVGCTVRYWVEATDNNDVTGPGVGKSARKVFVILSEEQKKAELLEQLAARAASVEDLYRKHRQTNEELNAVIRRNQK